MDKMGGARYDYDLYFWRMNEVGHQMAEKTRRSFRNFSTPLPRVEVFFYHCSTNILLKRVANSTYNLHQRLTAHFAKLGNRCLLFPDLVAWRFHERNARPTSRSPACPSSRLHSRQIHLHESNAPTQSSICCCSRVVDSCCRNRISH